MIKVFWIFSIILESVCVLPQLILLRQTDVPTVIDSFYLLTLGSYRAFYIFNWILRAIRERHVDLVAVIFGIVQTAFYIDFAWVYWTRQRVKLRNGGVVDSDDLSRGWLLSRLLGGRRESMEAEEGSGGHEGPNAASNPPGKGRWGARGVSVSADEDHTGGWQTHQSSVPSRDSKLGSDGFDDMLEDDEDDYDKGKVLPTIAGSDGAITESTNNRR